MPENHDAVARDFSKGVSDCTFSAFELAQGRNMLPMFRRIRATATGTGDWPNSASHGRAIG